MGVGGEQCVCMFGLENYGCSAKRLRQFPKFRAADGWPAILADKLINFFLIYLLRNFQKHHIEISVQSCLFIRFIWLQHNSIWEGWLFSKDNPFSTTNHKALPALTKQCFYLQIWVSLGRWDGLMVLPVFVQSAFRRYFKQIDLDCSSVYQIYTSVAPPLPSCHYSPKICNLLLGDCL